MLIAVTLAQLALTRGRSGGHVISLRRTTFSRACAWRGRICVQIHVRAEDFWRGVLRFGRAWFVFLRLFLLFENKVMAMTLHSQMTSQEEMHYVIHVRPGTQNFKTETLFPSFFFCCGHGLQMCLSHRTNFRFHKTFFVSHPTLPSVSAQRGVSPERRSVQKGLCNPNSRVITLGACVRSASVCVGGGQPRGCQPRGGSPQNGGGGSTTTTTRT